MNYLQQDRYGMYRNQSHLGPGPALMGANTLIGNEVYNTDEEHLGQIKEIMIDTIDGAVAYAVLSYGGVFGMGDKLFAVPWNALRLDTANKRFVLDADKENLKNAPGFDAGPGPGGPRPVPSHPIPPVEDPNVTEPRPEPITELPDHPPAKEPPETPPAPKRL